ncbi:phage regulatory CII family protein [Acinetobacter ursingii]|uniref:phage regulatory CII family protein n=1 Tax=Acinetobacter ursingii TaxID=108980 RepID=UPI0021CD4E68|nr:phage regulatory CII family protein [Acinetobacter ursingii]MCU4481333.1 phage regulatory CII family protein [Acinetobacter ursingii]MCU4505665.1 phage regulatory CII family protein [Acinetobacter ursingii]MCU4569611.1 phage regulatory CII family protein [Acinetobacter ursingii]
MNILDAAYHTVHDFLGGASALASRLGIKSPAVLNSKVNPNTHTHHITLLEAVKLMEITGDYRILQEICAQLGKVAIDLPDIPESKRDTSLMDTFLYLAIHKGNVSKTFREMMADGRITQGEAIDMSRVIHEMHVTLAKLDQQVQSCISK